MKKAGLFVTLLLSACCTFIFAGCSAKDRVSAVRLSGGNQSIVVEVGKFDFDDYKVVVSHASGAAEEIALTEDMISPQDRLKLYQVGKQTISIVYKNCSCQVQIIVERLNFDDISFDDKTVVYTGETFVMEVQGNVPDDATVFYPGENFFSQVGEYKIKAICYGDNYQTKEFEATLTILPAEYNFNDVKFEDAVYVYDGEPKSISVAGSMPSGVSVEYKIGKIRDDGAEGLIGERSGNSQTNAGRYEVTANFYSTNANFKQISPKKAILTIKKAKIANFDVPFADRSEVYTGLEYSIEADLEAMPKGVEAYYTIQQIKNSHGVDVSGEVQKNLNGTISAGTYVVGVNFKVADAENYEEIEPKFATLFIDRAEYKIENVFMNSKSVVYDGEAKSISLSGLAADSEPELPYGVRYSYSIVQFKDGEGNVLKDENGNVVERPLGNVNSAVAAGSYKVVAHLTSDDENYKEIDDIDGVLEIAQAEYSDLTLMMSNLSVNFDGNEHAISIVAENLPQTISVKYTIKKIKNADGSDVEGAIEIDGNAATEAGVYVVRVSFENSDKNYVSIASMTAELTILEVRA